MALAAFCCVISARSRGKIIATNRSASLGSRDIYVSALSSFQTDRQKFAHNTTKSRTMCEKNKYIYI